jgi:heme exporter protein D
MVEHVASGCDYQDIEQTNNSPADVGCYADNARCLLAIFDRGGAGATSLHHFGKGAKRGSGCRGCCLVMNWSNFFYLGGYGFYVWGSYIATLILLGAEVLQLLRRRKTLREQHRR